jgi:hypothetical protein
MSNAIYGFGGAGDDWILFAGHIGIFGGTGNDYPRSSISEVHQRIAGEIHIRQVKRALGAPAAKDEVFRGTTAGAAIGPYRDPIGQKCSYQHEMVDGN